MGMYRILLNESLMDITKNGNSIFFYLALIFFHIFYSDFSPDANTYCNWCVIVQFLVWHIFLFFFFFWSTFFILHILLWEQIRCRIFSNEYFFFYLISCEKLIKFCHEHGVLRVGGILSATKKRVVSSFLHDTIDGIYALSNRYSAE